MLGSEQGDRVSIASGNGQPPAGWYLHPQTPDHERWWDGAGWTEHYRPKAAVAQATTSRPTGAQSSLACPNCASEQVKTLRIINAQGTSIGTGSTTGWVQGSGNQPGHMATFSTRTKIVTEAARSAAAPRKRFNGAALIVIGVVIAGAGSFIGYSLGKSGYGSSILDIAVAVIVGLIVILGGVVLALRDSTYNRNVYPGAYTRWDRSWQCQRCGTVFVA
jgi:hypothetical protein